MTNRRKTKRLRVVAGQGTGESPRSGRLQAVGSEAVARGTRVRKRELPAMPETAASGVHVITVNLRGAVPPLWRRLELPSTITFGQLHDVLAETFGWSNFGPHSFMTTYGEFGGPVRPASRAAKRAADRRDESGVTLAQAGDSESAEILYLHGYDDEWRVEITVDRIRPAAPGVAYPRCTVKERTSRAITWT
jgi:hypothetical protein